MISDYFFSNEVSKNVDGYRISTYLYKDRNKTLKAGPAWDYDIAYGNADYCGGDDTLNWAYQFPCTGDYYQIPAWWPRMLTDSNFTNQMRCRWNGALFLKRKWNEFSQRSRHDHATFYRHGFVGHAGIVF